MTTPRKRNKNGLAYRSPIALRLMPDEREQAALLARSCGKTMSAFARDAYLAGLPLIFNSSPTAAANTAVTSGGAGCICGTASFYSKSTGGV